MGKESPAEKAGHDRVWHRGDLDAV